MELKSETRTENLSIRIAPSVKAAAKANAQGQGLTLADYIEMLIVEDTPDQEYRGWLNVQHKNAEKVLRAAAEPLGIDIDDADFNINNAYRLAELHHWFYADKAIKQRQQEIVAEFLEGCERNVGSKSGV